MTASLRVKNGIYHIVYSYKGEDGKWNKRSESTHLKERGNKKKAEAIMRERLSELEKQVQEEKRKRESVIFLPAMKDWLDDVMVHKVRQNTLHQYQHVYVTHISTYEEFKDVLVKDVTPLMLQNYVNSKSKKLSPETVRKHFANLHKFFDYAWKLNLTSSNPADKVELPSRRRKQHDTVFNEQQLISLLNLFQGDVLETAILITATYGLRRSEICGLEWSSIDFGDGKTGYMYINSTAIVDCGKVVYSDLTKSSSSRRRLPLTPMIRDHLLDLKQKQEHNRFMCGDDYHKSNLVCCWPDGSPILPEYMSRHFKSILAQSNLPHIQLRKLRNSAATLLHKKGFDAKSIQGLLGHADASTTANIYIDCDEKDLQDMTDIMEQTFKDKIAL